MAERLPESKDALTARRVAEVPLDPAHAAWVAAAPYEVQLLPQQMFPPLGGGSVERLVAKALHDGKRFGVHLAWADSSPESSTPIHAFRDACAVMFPAVEGERPPFLMGAKDKPVVLWQWKPDWEKPEAAARARAERYPEYADYYNPANDQLFAPVGDKPRAGRVNVLVAEGPGSLTRVDDDSVESRSRFTGRGWEVVLRRAMPAPHPPIAPGWQGAANFAVWNGAAGEVGSRKSVSLQWHDLVLDGAPRGGGGIPFPSSPAVLAAAAAGAGIAYVIKRRMEVAARKKEGKP